MDNENRKELSRFGAIICAISALLFGGFSTYLIYNTSFLNEFANPSLSMVSAIVPFFFLLPTVCAAGMFGYATGWVVDRFSFGGPKLITAAITIVIGVLLTTSILYDVPAQVALFVFILMSTGFVFFLIFGLLYVLNSFVTRWR